MFLTLMYLIKLVELSSVKFVHEHLKIFPDCLFSIVNCNGYHATHDAHLITSHLPHCPSQL